MGLDILLRLLHLKSLPLETDELGHAYGVEQGCGVYPASSPVVDDDPGSRYCSVAQAPKSINWHRSEQNGRHGLPSHPTSREHIGQRRLIVSSVAGAVHEEEARRERSEPGHWHAPSTLAPSPIKPGLFQHAFRLASPVATASLKSCLMNL